MKRGEVWWVNVNKPAGRRPVVLLSRDTAYTVRESVTVAPVTRTIHGIPVEVRLGQADGMPTECVVNLDSILTICKKEFDRVLTTPSQSEMALVDQAIKFALNLS